MAKTLEPETKIKPRKAVASRRKVVSKVEGSVGESLPKKAKWRHKLSLVKLGAILLALVLVIFISFWFFGSGLVVDNISENQLTPKQQSVLLDKMSKHIELPSDTYQIAVAVDVDKLKTLSPFYNRVKEGDIVVVYPYFAVIYDERSDIIVNATMLNQQ